MSKRLSDESSASRRRPPCCPPVEDAAGSFDARSDVDVLIVGNASFADISEALTTAEQRLNREVTPTVYSLDEFRQKIAEGHHFLTRALSEPKIMLVGNEDDIERMGRPAPPGAA